MLRPFSSVPIETQVACSLLRRGDTRAARELQSIYQEAAASRDGPSPSSLLDALIARLPVREETRRPLAERVLREAETVLTRARRASLAAISFGAPGYPRLLAEIADPPILLWARASTESGGAGIEALGQPAVAVVGSRDASAEGVLTARRLSAGLASAGLVVVSGLARGIDGAAHRGALEARGQTVAVLGCGADIVYPPGHRGLAEEVRTHGALVSEFPPGTPPLPHHFPLRNRLISGLSLAVVVVEASEKSGSLITARMALEQGRDVLAVPGGVGSGRFRGCHALIKDGARLVETVEDILEEVGWRPALGPQSTQTVKSLGTQDLAGMLRPGEVCSLDDLAHRTGRPAGEILAELSGLELAGLVERVGGGNFVRLDGPAMDR